MAWVWLAFAVAALGQSIGGVISPPANVRPPGLQGVGVQQRLNQPIPAHLEFRDETGKRVRLGDYFHGKPMILSLVYFRCPMLCSQVLAGLASSLKAMTLNVGKDFEVLTVSFNPQETAQDASAAKAEYLKRYARPDAQQGWHFLTGGEPSIEELAKAAGFQYQYDPKSKQFAHSTAILVLTPAGKIAQYYYGVEFPARDLRWALVEASTNKIGNRVDQILLYCYHYDPSLGKYNLVIFGVLRLAGLLTMLVLGGFIVLMLRRERSRAS